MVIRPPISIAAIAAETGQVRWWWLRINAPQMPPIIHPRAPPSTARAEHVVSDLLPKDGRRDAEVPWAMGLR
jgi:hypothetical protein